MHLFVSFELQVENCHYVNFEFSLYIYLYKNLENCHYINSVARPNLL